MTKMHDDEKYDPIDELEEKCRKQVIEDQAKKNMEYARAKLVLGKDAAHTFFATLALKLEPVANWEIDTVATDGKKLHYNPDYFTIMLLEEAKGVLSAAVLKLALAHHARMGLKDQDKWQLASKLAVHPLVQEAGLKLPKNAVLPGKKPPAELKIPPKLAKAIEKLKPGEAAEDYYNQLPDGDGDECGGGGAGKPDVDGCGKIMPPGDGSDAANREAESEWQVNAAQARATAKTRGTLPGGIERLVEAILEPKVDWRDVLREFVSTYARNDYCWYPCSKRHIHMGLYLPGLRSEELGDVVLAVDTSGSIGQEELNRFAGEAQGILEAFDCSLTILYHDAAIARVQHWKSTDGPLVLTPAGGGGTDHHPVFQWIEENDVQPACIVCLTDMASSFPDSPPAFPVLWCKVGDYACQAPFGRVVEVDL